MARSGVAACAGGTRPAASSSSRRPRPVSASAREAVGTLPGRSPTSPSSTPAACRPRPARWTCSARGRAGSGTTPRSPSAPVDYVAGALLCAAGAMVANTLWSSPWPGWREPPLLFVGCVGLPSAARARPWTRSPTRSATPRRSSARTSRSGTGSGRSRPPSPRPRLKDWKKAVKDALAPASRRPTSPTTRWSRPSRSGRACSRPTPPWRRPRLLAQQEPKGLLLVRDELAGWVGGLDKYGGDGAERAFWIEAYGGRFKVVDRVKFDGKELVVPHLIIAILGGIQPDRLASMIMSGTTTASPPASSCSGRSRCRCAGPRDARPGPAGRGAGAAAQPRAGGLAGGEREPVSVRFDGGRRRRRCTGSGSRCGRSSRGRAGCS